jgi:hypothetical protein
VVAFCNLNHYDYLWAKKDISEIIDDRVTDQFMQNNSARDFATNLRRFLRFNLIRKNIQKLHRLYYDDFYLDQMLLSCAFQNEPCSIDDFMSHYDFIYGMCWRFNSGMNLKGKHVPIRTSGQVGLKHGLQMELYAGHAELQEKFSMIRGFKVFVFNKTNVYPIAADIGIDVSTGQATNIGIVRSFTNHLPAPFTNCLPTDIKRIDWGQNEILQFMYDNFVSGQFYTNYGFWRYAGNWTWNWTVEYSQSICVKLCFQKHLFPACGNY